MITSREKKTKKLSAMEIKIYVLMLLMNTVGFVQEAFL